MTQTQKDCRSAFLATAAYVLAVLVMLQALLGFVGVVLGLTLVAAGLYGMVALANSGWVKALED